MTTTPEDISKAYSKVIRLIDDSILQLDRLFISFEEHQKYIKVQKTFGTVSTVIGASTAVGALTGGLILIPIAVSATVVGTALNYKTVEIDKLKTTKSTRKINLLLNDCKIGIEKLQSVVERFNSKVLDSMRTHNIDWDTATLHNFECPENTNFNLISFLTSLKENISPIKIHAKGGIIEVSIGSLYLTFLAKNFMLEKLKEDFAFETNRTLKTVALIAATWIAKHPEQMKPIAGAAGIVAAVLIAINDLICIFTTFFWEHPALDSIREAKSLLQAQKELLTRSLKEFQEIQMAAKGTVLTGTTKFMQECLGGGYKIVNRRPESITFDEFVNGIGGGRDGGVLQLAFIAEMFLRPIEIFDTTVDGVIGRRHGNRQMKVEPFGRLRTSVPLRIELSGDHGQHLYRPLDSNGQPIDIVDDPRYPNRCLFDAIAYHVELSSNDLTEQLKVALLKSSVARDVYDINLESLFPQFRGGARRVRPAKGKTVRTTRSALQSFTGPNGETWSREVVNAIVRFENLDQGAKHSDYIGAEIRKLGINGSDHCGHIISKELGGPGDDINNFIPINPLVNQVLYRCFEVNLSNTLAWNPTWSAHFNVELIFDPSSAFPKRPFRIDVNVEFYDQHGTHLNDENLNYQFDNPDIKLE